MKAQMEIEQSAPRRIPFKLCETQKPPLELQEWLIEQLGILAIAFGEPITPERLRVYADDLLCDLSRVQLQTALIRARRELRFFPKIAELRDLAGMKAKDAQQVEANAAWEYANRYLRRHGVVKYDLDDRPAQPPRIEYALRRIGGFAVLNQITAESYPFKYKEFCEAYVLAPMADFLAPQLEAQFLANRSLGDLQRKLAPGKADKRGHCVRPTSPPLFVAKKIPEPLSESQSRDRREMLRQQTDMLRSRTEPKSAH
jgi:hypothetical protein